MKKAFLISLVSMFFLACGEPADHVIFDHGKSEILWNGDSLEMEEFLNRLKDPANEETLVTVITVEGTQQQTIGEFREAWKQLEELIESP